jgi:hypothetical protein
MKQPDYKIDIEEVEKSSWYVDYSAEEGFQSWTMFSATLGYGRTKASALRQAIRRTRAVLKKLEKLLEKELDRVVGLK